MLWADNVGSKVTYFLVGRELERWSESCLRRNPEKRHAIFCRKGDEGKITRREGPRTA